MKNIFSIAIQPEFIQTTTKSQVHDFRTPILTATSTMCVRYGLVTEQVPLQYVHVLPHYPHSNNIQLHYQPPHHKY